MNTGPISLIEDQDDYGLISHLLARITHDLNNPLMAILGSTSLLAMPTRLSPDQTARLLATVSNEAERMKQIVANMSKVASIHNPRLETLDLCQLLSEQITLRDNWLKKLGIEVKIDLLGRLPAVKADREWIKLLLSNLISNCRQSFKEVGQHEGIILFRLSLDEDRFVCLEVMDNGPGIPEEYRALVLKPFWSTRRSGGLGLGLFVCSELCQRMEGELTILAPAPSPINGGHIMVKIPVA